MTNLDVIVLATHNQDKRKELQIALLEFPIKILSFPPLRTLWEESVGAELGWGGLGWAGQTGLGWLDSAQDPHQLSGQKIVQQKIKSTTFWCAF